MESNSIKVCVKWGKNKFDDVPLNLTEPAIKFKQYLQSITAVPVDRQKIMVKGGTLKDDHDWSKLDIKNGHTFMLMGTAEGDVLKAPVEQTKFLEDLPVSQQGQAQRTEFYPPGLENLGNTCYMNATLQCLKAVPELTQAVVNYKKNMQLDGNDATDSLAVSLRELYKSMQSKEEFVSPLVFLLMLRQVFPQFGEKQEGHYMQQDAEECWSQLLHVLGQKVPKIGQNSSSAASFHDSIIAQLFGGEFVSTLQNTENKDEVNESKAEEFRKIGCHISETTNFLMDGIREGLQERIEKQSPSLNRVVPYVKKSQINKLPPYLTVQFMRFFWKAGARSKAKIVRPVEFPTVLDVFEFCTDELKAKLTPGRHALRDYEEKRAQEMIANKKKEKKEEGSDKMEIDTQSTNKSNEVLLSNETGQYELCAVLAHKGRSADSGHYVAFVKESGKWLKFDDDRVTVVTDDTVKQLSGKGGADNFIAYLCIYRSIQPPKSS